MCSLQFSHRRPRHRLSISDSNKSTTGRESQTTAYCRTSSAGPDRRHAIIALIVEQRKESRTETSAHASAIQFASAAGLGVIFSSPQCLRGVSPQRGASKRRSKRWQARQHRQQHLRISVVAKIDWRAGRRLFPGLAARVNATRTFRPPRHGLCPGPSEA